MKDLDFTPQYYRQAAQLRLARKRRFVWVALLLASMGTWTLWKQAQLFSAESRLETMRQHHEQQNPMVAEATSLRMSLDNLLDREARLRQVEGGAKLHLVLAELSACLPDSVYLNSLRIQQQDRLESNADDIPADQAQHKREDVPRLNVMLRGHAVEDLDVGRLVHALTESRIFEEVKLSYSRPHVIGRRRVREFEIQCRLPRFL